MFVRDFIKDTLAGEIERMTMGDDGVPTHPYVGFSLISSSIEVLGACLDNHDWSKSGLSEARFRLAVEKLFPFEYQAFNVRGGKIDLYTGLRCSLVHCLVPGVLIGLSERVHEKNAGMTGAHLKIQNGSLLLIYEYFLNDFKLACEKIVSMIDKKGIVNQKVYAQIISVPNDNI